MSSAYAVRAQAYVGSSEKRGGAGKGDFKELVRITASHEELESSTLGVGEIEPI